MILFDRGLHHVTSQLPHAKLDHHSLLYSTLTLLRWHQDASRIIPVLTTEPENCGVWACMKVSSQTSKSFDPHHAATSMLEGHEPYPCLKEVKDE